MTKALIIGGGIAGAPRPRLERGTYCLGGSRSIR
jgi:hypothetical protein